MKTKLILLLAALGVFALPAFADTLGLSGPIKIRTLTGGFLVVTKLTPVAARLAMPAVAAVPATDTSPAILARAAVPAVAAQTSISFKVFSSLNDFELAGREVGSGAVSAPASSVKTMEDAYKWLLTQPGFASTKAVVKP